MKNRILLSCLMLATVGAICAQPARVPESLTAWPHFKEMQLPQGSQGLVEFVLDREALDKARPDAADVRVYDGHGREIPYVLRVRHAVESLTDFEPRVFNKSAQGGTAEASCDLGEEPEEHNQVDVDTPGTNFRRIADVDGSADGEHWSTLASQQILFRFSAEDRTVEQKAISYPVSRFRYLRVRVARDPQVDRAAPEIQGVRVRRMVSMKGEMSSFPASLEAREPDRVDGRPASIWRIDLGARVPVERLRITTQEVGFSRPFRLEAIDDPAQPVELASGDLTRSDDASSPEPVIDFAERFARHLKLTVTDDRNMPLRIANIVGEGASRELIFLADATVASPIRLYYGNPAAPAPRYDIASRIRGDAPGPVVRLTLGPERANPTYQPESQPLSQRLPWLVYVVLAGASIALAAMLLKILRQASARLSEPAKE